MLAGNRVFVRNHPVATKRAVRALWKAADLCALEPERAVRPLMDKDYVSRYDYALQTMKEAPYNRWREYDPEDTLRFYAKSAPIALPWRASVSMAGSSRVSQEVLAHAQ